MQTRLLLALIAIVTSVVAVFLMAFVGIRLCAPLPLAGDEEWTRMFQAQLALERVQAPQSMDCFTDNALGERFLTASEVLRPLPLMIGLALVFWETLGWRLRLLWFQSFGSHVVLSGSADLLSGVPRRFGPRVWLVHDRAERQQTSRAHPFRHIVDLRRRPNALNKVGLKTAKLIVAASHTDADNLELADAAIAQKAGGEVLVRLERPISRALFADDLRIRAAQAHVDVLCMSFSQMRQRMALDLAMPGRFVDTRAHGFHFVIAGDGPELAEMAELIARQGYGAEDLPPLLSVLVLDGSSALHPVLMRLQDATAAVSVVIHHPEAQDREGIDQAMLRIVQDNPPIASVYCTGSKRGDARGLALRWERLFLASRVVVPPIVALDDGSNLGTTGMIRSAQAPDLASCRDISARLDQHARAAHEAYIAGQKKARGAAFGARPAEREWDALPERFRDDNRAFADHMGFKLSVAGLVVGKDRGAPGPDPAKHPRLARVEHARWMSARLVDRWHYGEVRDDTQKIHPDIRPFDDLDHDAKQKDADVISSMTTTLNQCGEALFEEVIFALDETWTPSGQEVDRLLQGLRTWAAEHLGCVPVLSLPISDVPDIELASCALRAKCRYEIVLDPQRYPASDLAQNPSMRVLLRNAWRIRIVADMSTRAITYRAQDLVSPAKAGM